MSVSAHSAVINASLPGSTAFNQVVCTKRTANTVWQLPLAAQQRLDPSVDLVVEVDADGPGAGGYAVADPATYVVNYCFGCITFLADQGASAAVRATGAYVSMVAVAEAKDVSLTLSNELVEQALFGDGYKTRKVGGQDCSVEVSHLTPTLKDLDPGAGTMSLDSLAQGGTAFLLEVQRPGSVDFRAWVRVAELGHKLTPGALYEGSIKLAAAPLKGSNQTEYAAFGFSPF